MIIMKTKPKKIYVTESDLHRLSELIRTYNAAETKDKQGIMILQQELNRASVVKSEKVANNVVTMNSRIRLVSIETQKEMTYQIVYPWDVNVEEGKISVLSPIGTAVLGYKKGDIIEWKVPAGMRTFKIEEILYQPEATGNYNE